jgi:hypothetical protein
MKMSTIKENISYFLSIFSNAGGFITPYAIEAVPSELVRELAENAIWSIACIGTFITGITALCFILSKKYETLGSIVSIPIGYFGESTFPLGIIWLETFKFPTFGTGYISQIFSEYLGYHFIAGLVIWVIVYNLYKKS